MTHSAVLHAYFWRSQMLLTFFRHQLMYSVFCIVPCVEVACKGLFLMQQHSKEQQGTSSSTSFVSLPALFGFML